MQSTSFLSLLFLFFFAQAYAQEPVIIEGYVYEENDRGFIKDAEVQLFTTQMMKVGMVITDEYGHYKFETTSNRKYLVRATSKLYFKNEIKVDPADKNEDNKIFLKMEMERKPGYIFDVTLAEPRPKPNAPTSSVEGASIEIFNNTTNKMEWVSEDHPSPYFKFTFEQGNHYTVMISKERYITKQIEAYVNVNGCIVCIDGVDNVNPGVKDNLTAGHQKGTLLANIEMRPIKIGEQIPIGNLYYKSGRFSVTKDMHKVLDELTDLLINNPSLIVELRSHTDAQGDDGFNKNLSMKRASAAVEYILKRSNVDEYRLKAVGMGESKLVNKCKNGVKCSDKEHAKNRRTELVITGLLANKHVKLPLSKIKEEERMAKMLEEVISGEQIQIPESGEMPEELKRQIEKDNKAAKDGALKIHEESKSKKGTDGPLVEEKVEEKVEEVKELALEQEEKTKEIISKEQREIPIKAEPKTKKKIKSSTDEELRAAEERAKKVFDRRDLPAEELNPPRMEIQPKIEEEKVKPIDAVKDEMDTTVVEVTKEVVLDKLPKELEKNEVKKPHHGKIITETEISDSETALQIKELEADYTGFMIQVKRSPYELPNSDIVFQDFSDITYYRSLNGDYIYLTGNYATRTIGKVSLKYIKRSYPRAKLRLFKKGKMTN